MPRLRVTSTWQLLEALEQEALLCAEDSRTLRDAYSFLRRLESALRIVDDRSINVLPESPIDQRRLARRLGYQDSDIAKAERALLEEVQQRTAEVRTLYERAIQELRERHHGMAH